jgi:thiol-disulfide isomerase/thioredoxin
MLLIAGLMPAVTQAVTRELRLADNTEVTVEVYPAAGDTTVLWLPSGIAGATQDAALAAKIGALGIEVWRADLLEARFLPPLDSSLEQVPDSDVTTLIDAARAGGKRVVLMATARSAVLALRGARQWQAAHPRDKSLLGAILFHPNLYLGSPEPGREIEFQPVVAETRLPLFLIQPEKSPRQFWLDATVAALRQAGAPVAVTVIPGVRDRYFFRPDPTPEEETEKQRMPARVAEAIAALRAARPPVAVTAAAVRRDMPGAPNAARATNARELNAYAGNPLAPALALEQLGGGTLDLAALRGRVVLVNFWASWCPPCVHEMPSMQRLKEKLAGRPFTILAVNMAEPENDIREFLKKLPVDFPVLLDRDGAVLKRWKAFVFPTSYVLDTEGRIRFAVYGVVDWDSAETVGKMESLMPAAR